MKKIIENPYGFIYITTCVLNGKRYIGQKVFSYNWKSYLGSGTSLLLAIKKYGRKNFYRDIVAVAYSKEELDRLEIEFISNYNATDSKSFYNIAGGGSDTDKIKGYSEEQKVSFRRNVSKSLKNSIAHKQAVQRYEFRKAQSENKLEMWKDEEFKKYISEAMKKGWTKEKRIKQSENAKRQHENLEHKEKIRKKFKERWDNNEERERLCNSMKKIFLVVDIETKEYKEFLGRKEVAEYIKKSEATVKKYMQQEKLFDGKFLIIRKDKYFNTFKI